jgi:arginine N-succinyltransferase
VFVVRRGQPEDVSTLLKLAKMVHFINLPADQNIIASKVAWSRQCFMLAEETVPVEGAAAEVSTGKKGKSLSRQSEATQKQMHATGGGTNGQAAVGRSGGHSSELAGGLKELTGRSPLFLFVLEELESRGVIGTSQIISRMGGPGQPNLSLALKRRELFSTSLQTGVTHTLAQLYLDESGPTEIGGLILQPSYRGHRQKLGRLISLIRFHYIALYRHMFQPRVLAEMMGPLSADGHSPFWDACTRLFINMSYDEADRFCQESKEFILSLFPREEIYLTLLPPEARACVGAVSPETVPARRMLEGLGFKCPDRVDPFDAGPHLEQVTDLIPLVQQTSRVKLAEVREDAIGETHGFVSAVDEDGEFRAVECGAAKLKGGKLGVSGKVLEALRVSGGGMGAFTVVPPPMGRGVAEVTAASSSAKKSSGRKKPAKG